MAIKPVEILITAKDKASGVFDLLKKNALSLGATIAAYFGVKAFVGAVQGAAELEAKLSEVKAVAGATNEEMALIRKSAEDAGAATKYTATESAEALGNLARAGLSVNQAIETLPGVLSLAQAGGIDLAQASEITTKALAGFGLEANKAGLIADVLAKGANASNTSVLGLAQGLSYAAPTAKSLNLPLETTVALLGKFADGGIDASRGGTALNAILSQFLDPASKFRTELAAMGITTNNFEDALHQLAAAGPAGQKAILAVGTEAGPALRSLLNQGIGAFDELKKTLNDAKGSAEATAATMQDNLAGSMLSLGSVWDTVKNALATPILPVLRDGVTQLITSLRSAVSDGSVGRFGDILAKGFGNALAAIQTFVGQVDFDALAAKVSGAAERVGQAFVTVETYARNTGNTVQLAWGVMSAGANGVLLGIYALGTAFGATASAIVKGAAIASEALAKIAITDSAKKKLLDDAAAMRDVLAGLEGVTQEFAANANQSLESMAEGAQAARDGWAGLNASTESANDKAKTSVAVFEQVGESLKNMGDDAQAAGQKTQAALQAVSSQAKATEEDVVNAFTRMGIQTSQALTQAADNAKRDYQVIKDSGLATAAGLETAFRQYAEAAIAANNGVASSALQAEARARGLELASDGAGKAIVRSMEDARIATEGVDRATRGAAGGYRDMAQSAEQAAASAQKLAEINKRYSRPGQNSTQKGNEDNYDPGRNVYGRAGQNDQPRNGNGQTQAEFQRAEKLQGQAASDDTLRFELLAKLNKGQLSESDLADLKNVVATLSENQKMFDSLGIGTADVSTLADDRKWQAIQTRFEQAIATFEGSNSSRPGNAGVGRTVNVNINTGSGSRKVPTTEAGAADLVAALRDAGLSAGR